MNNLDQIALDAAKNIEALRDIANPVMRTARIQLIVLEAIKKARGRS
ncbi:hypothetical protein LOC51_19850 [Rubrivivax sp. JA1024]|nr:hypothetical protein [Rubrivivax sp. JA1024]